MPALLSTAGTQQVFINRITVADNDTQTYILPGAGHKQRFLHVGRAISWLDGCSRAA